MISFIQTSPKEQDVNVGYGLVTLFSLNYTFRAIFVSWSRQAVARFRIRLRACLISIVYQHTLRIAPKDVNLGSATILMNVDVEKVIDAAKYLHDFWSLGITCVIAAYLLYRQLGVLFVAPLFTVICALGFSTKVGTLLKPRQRQWVDATEKRVTSITYAAGNMKAIRMLGLTEVVRTTLEGLRETEVALHR